MQYLEFFEKRRFETINLLSVTGAIGWSSLFNSFSSENKANYQQFLPVNLEPEKINVKQGYVQPTEKTMKVLKRVLNLNRLPKKVITALAGTGVLMELDKY
jgi:hypothetical protein